jgi:hypothetical protein
MIGLHTTTHAYKKARDQPKLWFTTKAVNTYLTLQQIRLADREIHSFAIVHFRITVIAFQYPKDR